MTSIPVAGSKASSGNGTIAPSHSIISIISNNAGSNGTAISASSTPSPKMDLIGNVETIITETMPVRSPKMSPTGMFRSISDERSDSGVEHAANQMQQKSPIPMEQDQDGGIHSQSCSTRVQYSITQPATISPESSFQGTFKGSYHSISDEDDSSTAATINTNINQSSPVFPPTTLQQLMSSNACFTQFPTTISNTNNSALMLAAHAKQPTFSVLPQNPNTLAVINAAAAAAAVTGTTSMGNFAGVKNSVSSPFVPTANFSTKANSGVNHASTMLRKKNMLDAGDSSRHPKCSKCRNHGSRVAVKSKHQFKKLFCYKH